jgi:hypothetical protein
LTFFSLSACRLDPEFNRVIGAGSPGAAGSAGLTWMFPFSFEPVFSGAVSVRLPSVAFR